MVRGLTLVQVEAIEVFTKTTIHGQFHGDPTSARNAQPMVPDYVVGELLASGTIALLDRDPETPPVEPDPYAMKHLGFGKYAVTGPGIAAETVVQGKADAETLIATARTAYAADADAGSDEAPTD